MGSIHPFYAISFSHALTTCKKALKFLAFFLSALPIRPGPIKNKLSEKFSPKQGLAHEDLLSWNSLFLLKIYKELFRIFLGAKGKNMCSLFSFRPLKAFGCVLIFGVWFFLVFCSLAQAQPNRCAQFVVAPQGFSDTKISAEQIFIRPLNFKIVPPRNKYSLKNGAQSNHMLDPLPPTAREFRFNFTDKYSPLPGELYQVDILKAEGNLESFQVLLPLGHSEMLSELKQTIVDFIPEEFISHLGIIRLNPQPFNADPSLDWISKGVIEKAKKAGYIVNYTASQRNLRHVTAQKPAVIEIFDTLSSADNRWPHRLAEALAYNFLERAAGSWESNNFKYLAPTFDVNVHREKFADLVVAQKLAHRIHKGVLSMGAKALLNYLRPHQTVTERLVAEEFSEVVILAEDKRHYTAYYQDLIDGNPVGHTIPILVKGNLANTTPASLEILRYHLQKIIERLPHHWRERIELTLELNSAHHTAQVVKHNASASTPEKINVILKFSPALLHPDGSTLNASDWAKLIGGALGESYNEAFIASRQFTALQKPAAPLDPRNQFWAKAKSKAWHTSRNPASHWYSLPQMWWPTFQRHYARATKFNPLRSYTAKNLQRQNVAITLYNQKLMAASDKVRYVTSVSTPADLSPGERTAILEVVRQTLTSLPAEIPFLQGIKILPQGLYPYTGNEDVSLRPTAAMANFKGYFPDVQRAGTPRFDYYEDLVIGNFLKKGEMLDSSALAEQIRYGMAVIINNGLFKNAHHIGYPEEDFLALLPPRNDQIKQNRFERRERSIQAIKYYLEHRFVPNYDAAHHQAYQNLFNFLDKFFVAREATFKQAAQQIKLTSIRTSLLWKLLPIIYEEQNVLGPHALREFTLIAPDLALAPTATPNSTMLQLADLGEVTMAALDQFRYGLNAFLEDHYLSATEFLPQVATIEVSTKKVATEANVIYGKVLSGHPSFLAYTDEVVNGRHHVTFYLEKELFHTKIGEAKILFTKAWKQIFPDLKHPPTDPEGSDMLIGRMLNDWFEY